MEFFEYHFILLNSVLKSDFDNTPTEDFFNLIDETKEKLKDLYDNANPSYINYCLLIDKRFEEYLSKFE
jgi:hypothetical protein